MESCQVDYECSHHFFCIFRVCHIHQLIVLLRGRSRICGVVDALEPAATLLEEPLIQSVRKLPNSYCCQAVCSAWGAGSVYIEPVHFPPLASTLLVPCCRHTTPHLLLSIPVDFPDSSPDFSQCNFHIAARVYFLKTQLEFPLYWGSALKFLMVLCALVSHLSLPISLPCTHHLSAKLAPFQTYRLSLPRTPDEEVFSLAPTHKGLISPFLHLADSSVFSIYVPLLQKDLLGFHPTKLV